MPKIVQFQHIEALPHLASNQTVGSSSLSGRTTKNPLKLLKKGTFGGSFFAPPPYCFNTPKYPEKLPHLGHFLDTFQAFCQDRGYQKPDTVSMQGRTREEFSKIILRPNLATDRRQPAKDWQAGPLPQVNGTPRNDSRPVSVRFNQCGLFTMLKENKT